MQHYEIEIEENVNPLFAKRNNNNITTEHATNQFFLFSTAVPTFSAVPKVLLPCLRHAPQEGQPYQPNPKLRVSSLYTASR